MVEEPIHYMSAALPGSFFDGSDGEEEHSLFEESNVCEQAALDWVLGDGFDYFRWTDAFDEAYKRWMVEGDED